MTTATTGGEPLASLDTDVTEPGPSTQGRLFREQSASPEPYTTHRDHFEPGDQAREHEGALRHKSISTDISPDLTEERRIGPATAPKAHVQLQSQQSIPPRAFNKTVLSEIDHAKSGQRRQSTVDTKNSASFEETAPWDEKAVLSLDGGGIRGYSALLVLQELMKAIGRIESAYDHDDTESGGPAESSYHPLPPDPSKATDPGPGDSAPNGRNVMPPKTESSSWLPCHYFDYMAGTSTGGLISIMLGRLRMNLDDCISEYETLGELVFGQSRKFHLQSPLFWARDKYNHEILEDVVRDVVRRRVPKVASFPGGMNFAFDENRCRIFVVAFQNYKNLHKSANPNERKFDRNPALAHDVPIWQVARATSAAPTYFKPAVIDGLEYLDGGFGANNHCEEIYHEVRKMNNDADSCIKILLSIGTGINNNPSRFSGQGLSRYLNYLNFARRWASNSEKTHERMTQIKNDRKVPFDYCRLNVEEGLDLMKLDEWRARGKLKTKAGRWLGQRKSRKSAARSRDQSQRSKGAAGQISENSEKIRTAHAENGQNGAISIDPAKSSLESQAGIGHTKMTTIAEEKGNGSEERKLQANDERNGNLNAGNHSTLQDTNLSSGPQTSSPQWLRPKIKTLDTIKSRTAAYLSQRDVQDKILHCAEILVEGRRSRARSDRDRWEKACFGAWFQCNIGACPRAEKEYQSRRELKKHLLDKHRDIFSRGNEGLERLEAAIDSCKIVIH